MARGQVCGDWWQRHVVAYDKAHNLTYECWCSACHCPSPDGEKDLDFLRVKYGWDADRALRRRTMPPAPVAREGQLTAQRSGGNSSVAQGEVGSMAGAHSHKFTVEDDLDLFAADGLDFRHVSGCSSQHLESVRGGLLTQRHTDERSCCDSAASNLQCYVECAGQARVACPPS